MKRYKITVLIGNQTKDHFVEGHLRFNNKRQIIFKNDKGEVVHRFPVKRSLVELLTNKA